MKGFRITLYGWYLLLMAFIAVSLVCLMSCKSVRYVEVEKVRTDTTYITKQQRDSIWLHDSLYIHEYTKGDTVFLERTKWHTRYVERLLTDTLYKATHDTIPQPYPVEKKLGRWSQFKVDYGGYAMILFIILVICVSIWSRRRRMNTF